MSLADLAIKPSASPDAYSVEDDLMDQSRDLEPEEGDELPDTPKEDPVAKLMRWGDPTVSLNIATELTDIALGSIGMRVVEETEIDISSRSHWLEQGKKAMEMALQKPKAKTFPWPNSANIIFPLMTQAADQFAARAYPGIIQNRNVVKGIVSGQDDGTPQIDPQTGQPAIDPNTQQPLWQVPPGAKAARAQRIGDHMSWQLIEEQDEWEGETDTLLNVLAIIGCEFRKTYYDPDLGRNMAVRVSAENMIINYWAKSMATAPRLTERIFLYPYQIKERIESDYFMRHDYISSTSKDQDRDAPQEFYEQHRRLDLDGDGYPEPYIVTVHKESMKVCRIVARYDIEDGIKTHAETGKIAKVVPVHYYTKYDFMPNKEGGIYGQGFGQLLTPINESVNTVLNQLIDAGTLQNTGGGFIGKGLSMHAGTVSFRPGEYKVVNAVGNSIRESVVPLVHAGPSAVLLTLLGTLIEAGKDISSVKDVLAGELKAQTMSPTVFMALIEQGLKVFTSIYKRIHRSLKDEFEKLYRLNRLYLQEQTSYRIGDQWKKIERADYEAGAGVDPISDPTMVVDAQRMARTQVLAEFKDDPLCDGLEIRRRIFEAASIDNIDKILKGDPAPNPELMLKASELEIKMMGAKVGVLVGLSTVFRNMAEADAKVMEPFIQWQQQQLQAIQQDFDAITAKSGEGAPAPDQPPAAAPPMPMAPPQPPAQGVPPLAA